MEKRGIVSVIVPVYKVEKYIEECVESILGQTYSSLEIILVDDGSPDCCGAVCDRYARQDPRVMVLHRNNGGAAAARNAGLRAATGEYITFVDGDDYLLPDACAHMVRTLEDTDADIVQSGFRYVYANGTLVHDGGVGRRIYSITEYLTCFTGDWTCALCWGKLFRRHMLMDVFFEEGHLIDDEFFTYRAVMNARKIVYAPTVTYHYRQRSSGVMKDPTTLERKNRDALEAVERRWRDVGAGFPELEEHFACHYADYLLCFAVSDSTTINTILEIKKRLRDYLGSGKVLPWKQGQRKLFLRSLYFLAQPAERIYKKRKVSTNDSGYEFFE